jgi:uncharacterized protein
MEQEGEPGATLLGTVIPPEIIPSDFSIYDASMTLLKDKLIALRKGILVRENGVMKILGPDTIAHFILDLNKSQTELYAHIFPGISRENAISKDDILHQARQLGVQADLAEEELTKCLEHAGKLLHPSHCVLAKGTPPQNATPAHFHHLLSFEPDLTPLYKEDGSVDYKSIHMFREVSAGTALSELIPGSPALAGVDVFGKTVAGETLVDPPKELGHNTQMSTENPHLVIASKNGVLSENTDGMPEVQEFAVVSSDVDYHTGNLKFTSPVHISGDVRSDFCVTSSGTIEIDGVVEDARVESEQSVIVKQGFTGTGKGIISSRKSSVTIGHIQRQQIRAGTDIILGSDAIYSRLFAEGNIIMTGKNKSIIGGYLCAFEQINIYNAGNLEGAKTVLEVGRNEIMRQRIEDLEQKMALLQKQRHELMQWLERLEKQGMDFTPLITRSELELRGCKALENARKQLESYAQARRKMQEKLINSETCIIAIHGTAYAGVTLKFPGYIEILNAPVTRKRWICVQGQPPKIIDNKE